MNDYKEVDYTVGVHYLPAIINDDWTGLDELEILELTTFLDSNSPKGDHAWCIKALDNPAEFTTCEVSNLYSECEKLTLLTKYDS